MPHIIRVNLHQHCLRDRQTESGLSTRTEWTVRRKLCILWNITSSWSNSKRFITAYQSCPQRNEDMLWKIIEFATDRKNGYRKNRSSSSLCTINHFCIKLACWKKFACCLTSPQAAFYLTTPLECMPDISFFLN